MIESQPLNVFLCHSSSDKAVVRNLYRKLKQDAIDPWLDEEKIPPGQNWESEINSAVRNCDAVIVCLSRSSITKEGYVQKEIRIVLNLAGEKPEGVIFLIPLKLEECEVPDKLRPYHWATLFGEGGYEKLLQALRVRASQLEAKAAQEVGPASETQETAPIADLPQRPDDLDRVLTLLVQPQERKHLLNLQKGDTKNYVGRHSLRDELRNLRVASALKASSQKFAA